jgi:hypothetical protein
MDNTLTNDIIHKFVRLGETYSENDPSYRFLLSEVSSHDNVNRLHWSEWDQFTKKMPTSNLISLIKGLTLAETHYRWIGGSVSSVIWVFRQFSERETLEFVNEIMKWVFDNRWNHYIPLGTMKYSSYEDYQWQHSTEYYDLKRKRLESHCKREKKQQQIAKLRRAEKDRMAKEHQKLTERKALYRQEIIQKLTAMDDPVECWNHIAMTNSVNIDFYPIEWAKEPIQALKALPSKTRNALIERLSYKRKGPWKNLRKILESIE